MIFLFVLINLLFGDFIINLFSRFKVIKKRDLYILEKVATSMLSGFLFLTIYMFVLGIFGISYSFYVFIPIYLISLSNLILFTLKLAKEKNIFNKIIKKIKDYFKKNKLETVIDLLLFILIVFLISTALSNFLTFPDEFSHWALQAKNIFVGKRMNTFSFTNIETYPNFIPLLNSAYYFMIGKISENSIRIFSSIFLITAIFTTVSFAKRYKLSTLYCKLLFLALIVLVPEFISISSSSYADVPFMTFYSLGILYLVEWIFNNRSKTFFTLSIIYMTGSTWIKTDGFYLLALTLVFLIFLTLTKKLKTKSLELKILDVIKYVVIVSVLPIMWKIYTNIYDFPVVNRVFELRLDYVLPIIKSIIIQLINNIYYILIVLLILFSFIFVIKKISLKEKCFVFTYYYFIIINFLLIVLSYITFFGGEGIIAPSFCRYYTRVIPIIFILLLIQLKNIKINTLNK